MWFSTFVLKNLRRRPLRSLLTVFAIGMAIASVVSLVGISNGFERTFTDLYKSAKVDMLVLQAGRQKQGSILDQSLATKIEQVRGVKEVLSGLVDIISFPDVGLYTVIVNGWEPETATFNHITITAGRNLKKDDTRSILLGSILAENLGKKVTDPPEKLDVLEGRSYEIVGLYESRNVFENGALVIPLKELQTIMDRHGKITGFSLVLEDPNNPSEVERIRKEVEALNPSFKAYPTSDFVKSFTEIRLAKNMAWLTSCIALMIGFFGITNTMVMAVNERTREIGILRAVGWRVTRVIRMILMEAVFLSVIGAVCGILGASIVVRILTRVPAVNGMIDGRIEPIFLIMGFLIAVCLGVLGSVLPAIRAARMMPTEALRHE